jgi:hypothetical protein
VAKQLAPAKPEESVRRCLVALSARLESQWRDATERLLDSPPGSAEHSQWEAAISRLTEALTSLEGYARNLDASVGRRDWAVRRPRMYGVSGPRFGPDRAHG